MLSTLSFCDNLNAVVVDGFQRQSRLLQHLPCGTLGHRRDVKGIASAVAVPCLPTPNSSLVSKPSCRLPAETHLDRCNRCSQLMPAFKAFDASSPRTFGTSQACIANVQRTSPIMRKYPFVPCLTEEHYFFRCKYRSFNTLTCLYHLVPDVPASAETFSIPLCTVGEPPDETLN